MSFFGPDLFCFFLLQRPESVTAASDVRDFWQSLVSWNLLNFFFCFGQDVKESSSVIVVCVWHDTRAHYWTLPLCCQGKLVFCQLLQKKGPSPSLGLQDQPTVNGKISEDSEAAAALKDRARLSAYYTGGPNQVVGYVTFFAIQLKNKYKDIKIQIQRYQNKNTLED